MFSRMTNDLLAAELNGAERTHRFSALDHLYIVTEAGGVYVDALSCSFGGTGQCRFGSCGLEGFISRT